MKVIVLGSGTGVICLERGSPGYLLKTNKNLFLIDSGAGTLTRILQAGYTLNQIDALFYTHIHPDHVTDLVPFLFASKYGTNSRRKKLTIVGGSGFKKFFNDLSKTYQGWLIPKKYELIIKEMRGSQFKIGSVFVKTCQPQHIAESVSFRFEERGKSVVFSGDTDFSENLIQLSKDVNLLILECSFPDSMKVKGHLTPTQAAHLAQKASPKQLVLSHFYPPSDRINILKIVRKIYSGKVVLAKDGLEIKV